jgi:hypothetical protein
VSNRTDTERLDWLATVCHVDAPFAPVIRGGDRGWTVWNQYDGLNKLGEGSTIREAIDAAMDKETP